MKPPPFGYRAAATLDEAFDLYGCYEGEAIWLAGGHSVVPSLALRLQAPAALIDISRLPELTGISVSPAGLRIGALTRHAEILSSPLVATHAPMLAQAAGFVAHPAIRNHATFGGNLALADPASEFPAVIRCLGATFDIAGPEGSREVAAEDFFLDLYTTALEPGEILRSVLIPPLPQGAVTGFEEISRRHGDFAMAGAAVRLVSGGRKIEEACICFHSVGVTPVRAFAAERTLSGMTLDATAIRAAQAALPEDLDPPDDPAMPAATRLHLARVVLGRILHRLGGEPGQ